MKALSENGILKSDEVVSAAKTKCAECDGILSVSLHAAMGQAYLCPINNRIVPKEGIPLSQCPREQ